MAYKEYYEYKDIMQATGKSITSVKKWRLKIEELSGYEFKKTRMRVSRRRVQDVYQFTEDEFDKFIRLSQRIDETNNMAQSVIEIWGDLKAREERQLKQDVADMKVTLNKLVKAHNTKNITISVLEKKVQKLEERIEDLEDNQSKGFFSRNKKKDR
ncbi:TPA: hypothetical protein ACUJUG_000665 [Streptococcus agalactiae]|uniref:hypothetical protein n=1 Tax=Streptococcus TaxID=1301 RepID=UPI000D76B71B|nr:MULTISPECIES: hypothetical protein [Streptococcus]HEM9977453.1 hypothetical protein [Streptococcus agalactiae]PXX83417.1 hypothetical protein DI495_04610 [Streptococcus dysgalactiae subsp. equisimilis]SQF10066.1 Uncharacterised protein [Streptococcus pyogenes]VGT99827.1 Uncharacterised protein [Streptococcus pyogenes]HEN0140752.1 hypothetical protein [Streptococcus agalactiae]